MLTTVAITSAIAKAAPSPVDTGRRAVGLSLPSGFHAEVYARGLEAPTAMTFGPDGGLYVSELGGGENAGAGQIAVISGSGASPRVLLDNIDKPTGLVWREQRLYIVAGRDILSTGFRNTGRLSAPRTVLRDLPYNGRSEGQIDLLPDGRLLFEASGNARDSQSSGMLLTLIPGDEPKHFATGLKNAYAYALDAESGQLYVTDIEDDPVNGKAAPDEINAVQMGGDYGWPRCYGNRRPAFNWGGSEQACAETLPPVLNLPPHATPTGLAYYAGSDFPKAYRKALYVALWNGQPPQVLRIGLARDDDRITGRATSFMTGDGFRPIDVLSDPQGGLLVLDFDGGVVYRIRRAGSPDCASAKGRMRGVSSQPMTWDINNRRIRHIRQALAAYPFADAYRVWPGPNSNTFTAWLVRHVPELHVTLPSTAIGKDWLDHTLVAATPSGTGYQLSLYGVLGLMAAKDEYIEINVLGLVFGIDPLSFAIKWPGIGRIGFSDLWPRREADS